MNSEDITILPTFFKGEADSGIYKIREEVHVALHPRFSSDLRVGLLNYFNSQINKWHKE